MKAGERPKGPISHLDATACGRALEHRAERELMYPVVGTLMGTVVCGISAWAALRDREP
jgi:hypothetical protein